MAVNPDLQHKVSEVRLLLSQLHDIRKAPIQYAISDLSKWMGHKLDRVSFLMDEIEIEIEADHPDQQRILNAEIENSIEEGVLIENH